MTYDKLRVLFQKIIKLFGCSEQLKLKEFGRTSFWLVQSIQIIWTYFQNSLILYSLFLFRYFGFAIFIRYFCFAIIVSLYLFRYLFFAILTFAILTFAILTWNLSNKRRVCLAVALTHSTTLLILKRKIYLAKV